MFVEKGTHLLLLVFWKIDLCVVSVSLLFESIISSRLEEDLTRKAKSNELKKQVYEDMVSIERWQDGWTGMECATLFDLKWSFHFISNNKTL